MSITPERFGRQGQYLREEGSSMCRRKQVRGTTLVVPVPTAVVAATVGPVRSHIDFRVEPRRRVMHRPTVLLSQSMSTKARSLGRPHWDSTNHSRNWVPSD